MLPDFRSCKMYFNMLTGKQDNLHFVFTIYPDGILYLLLPVINSMNIFIPVSPDLSGFYVFLTFF